MSDLLERLNDLAEGRHDDLSVGLDAINAIVEQQAEVAHWQQAYRDALAGAEISKDLLTAVCEARQAEIERLRREWKLPAHVKQAAAFIVEEMGEQFAQRLVDQLEYLL